MYIIYVSNYDWSGESHDLIEWMQYISCLPLSFPGAIFSLLVHIVFIVIVVTTDIEALVYVGRASSTGPATRFSSAPLASRHLCNFHCSLSGIALMLAENWLYF